jgi:hypothetical protein
MVIKILFFLELLVGNVVEKIIDPYFVHILCTSKRKKCSVRQLLEHHGTCGSHAAMKIWIDPCNLKLASCTQSDSRKQSGNSTFPLSSLYFFNNNVYIFIIQVLR